MLTGLTQTVDSITDNGPDALDRARERRERGEDGGGTWDAARDASAVHATPSVVNAAETARD